MAFYDGPTNNTVGGCSKKARNIISANWGGIWMSGAGTENNKIIGNYIGTDVELTQGFHQVMDIYAELSLDISVTEPSCGNDNGGAIVMVSGGVPPYYYVWSYGTATPI